MHTNARICIHTHTHTHTQFHTCYPCSLNTVLVGVLRGSGRQAVGFYVTFCTFWVIGMPLAAYLDLHQGMGVFGIWIALAAVSALQAIIFAAVCAQFDFHELVRLSRLLIVGPAPASAAHLDHHEGMHLEYAEEKVRLRGADKDASGGNEGNGVEEEDDRSGSPQAPSFVLV